MLLLVLVTGVLVHVKDLVRQLHQFRIAKSRRVLWSDMHKVLGVMGLPFQLAYAYTGAFLVLAPLLLGMIGGPVLGGGGGGGGSGNAKAPAAASADAKAADAAGTDAKAADAAGTDAAAGAASTDAAATALLGVPAGGPPEAGPATPSLPLDELVRRARAARPDFTPAYVHLFHHGHEHGIAEIWGAITATPSDTIAVRVRAHDGAILEAGRADAEGAAAATRRWIRGLHFARFGGLPLRFVLFGLALATCATILTGNWVWLARARPAAATGCCVG